MSWCEEGGGGEGRSPRGLCEGGHQAPVWSLLLPPQVMCWRNVTERGMRPFLLDWGRRCLVLLTSGPLGIVPVCRGGCFRLEDAVNLAGHTDRSWPQV